MDNITCSDCKLSKPTELFSKHKNRPNGYSGVCKKCSNMRFKAYSRTLNGLVSIMYSHQISSSKKRNHVPPNYSKEDLYMWVVNQPNFKTIYENWVRNNFVHELTPSIDRLDDYNPYTLNNIRLTDWITNKEKGSEDRKNGLNNKKNVSVLQLNKPTDEIVEVYYSISEASRQTSISRTGINKTCMGELKTSGGFKWRYE